MIDFHCHLDLYPDHQTAVDKREKEKTYTLSVTTTPQAWPQNRDVTADKQYVRAALGLHPQLVAERAAEIELWKRYLHETRYVGEVGLDAGPKYKHSFEQQKIIFTEILKSCAAAGDKILSVHSVRASREVLELVETYLPSDRGRVVLHWFTGTNAQIKHAASLSCYFSFNADMLQTARGRTVAAVVPVERILTETDAPFTKFPDLQYTVELLAEIRGIPKDEMGNMIVENLKALLS